MMPRRRTGPSDADRAASKLHDERGASVVIALVFFLICAIIGSVVLTAASVNAKAVQTNREMQQAEFEVSSAAQVLGRQFSAMTFTVDYSKSNQGEIVVADAPDASFGMKFWSNAANKSQIWTNRSTGSSLSQDVSVQLQNSAASMDEVAGTLVVDSDLNVTIELRRVVSGDAASDADAYRETVYVQCVPTFDQSSRLVAFSYEPAVITKSGAAKSKGGAGA